MTDAQKRILALNDRLKAAGVRNISFTWAPGAENKTNDELCNAVAAGLEALLDGRCTPINTEEQP